MKNQQTNLKSDSLDALKRQIHFIASTRNSLLVGLLLCIYLSFIVIVLQPFDTSQFEDDNKTALLSGYGIFIFVVYAVHGSIENIWYKRFGKVWTVCDEIVSTLLFCLFSGTVLYLYNRLIVNLTTCDLATYWRFLSVTVLCMMPVFVPPMLYLRQKFGEKIIPPAVDSFVLVGENKNEILNMKIDELLFIKAVENYVEICFVQDSEKVVSKTFRQTLSNVYRQLPFLEKCHRSYLVNTNNIKAIIGNSQAAKILFSMGDKEIPVSKTHYKQLKNKGF